MCRGRVWQRGAALLRRGCARRVAPRRRRGSCRGCGVFPQLWHVDGCAPALIGMAQSLPPGTDRLSPSGLAAPGRACGRAMTAAEIDATIAAFAQTDAAARAIGRALLANPDWVRTIAAGRAGDLAAFDRAVLETLD